MVAKKLIFPWVILGLCSSVMSFQSWAHGSHSHSHEKPQSEMARKAGEGIFDDNNVQDRKLSDWDGVWQSINPYLLNGDLESVLKAKAEKNKDKTIEEYRSYYKKGYNTDVDMIGIENNKIEFHRGETVDSCVYDYSGYKILHYSSGKKGVRYLFECTDSHSKAPKYVQFSDHIIEPEQSHHFHIYMGSDSQSALLNEMDNWPTYYPYTLQKEQIIDDMLHH